MVYTVIWRTILPSRQSGIKKRMKDEQKKKKKNRNADYKYTVLKIKKIYNCINIDEAD